MLLAGKGLTDGTLDDSEARRLLEDGLSRVDLDGRRVLVLLPDSTRTCPLPMFFRSLVELMGPRVAKLDFLIALGTHQPMSREKINQLVGVTEDQRKTTYRDVDIFNHHWDQDGTFTQLGTIPAARIEEITDGLMAE
ncbi:unnamed protein product, partial [marine sediment metagenome]